MSHCKTQIFSLIGRRIVLRSPHAECSEGVIAEQIGPGRFGCHLQHPDGRVYTSEQGHPVTVDLRRSEFVLPPLPRSER